MNIKKITERVKDALRLSAVIGCLAFVSCDDLESKKTKPTDIPENYRCTADQLVIVDKEFLICDKSGYFSSYCFLQAKKSQCTYIGITTQDGR